MAALLAALLVCEKFDFRIEKSQLARSIMPQQEGWIPIFIFGRNGQKRIEQDEENLAVKACNSTTARDDTHLIRMDVANRTVSSRV